MTASCSGRPTLALSSGSRPISVASLFARSLLSTPTFSEPCFQPSSRSRWQPWLSLCLGRPESQGVHLLPLPWTGLGWFFDLWAIAGKGVGSITRQLWSEAQLPDLVSYPFCLCLSFSPTPPPKNGDGNTTLQNSEDGLVRQCLECLCRVKAGHTHWLLISSSPSGKSKVKFRHQKDAQVVRDGPELDRTGVYPSLQDVSSYCVVLSSGHSIQFF